MYLLMALQFLVAFLALPTHVLSYGRSYQQPPGRNAILLSNVQTLTLRGDRLTSARRVSPIPQLKCVGPSKRICNAYPIDIMRCTNAGYDYDEEDVQWTCTASLPQELKLGSTDVICEGYRDADDRWILKGSCGVEYRLLLTDLGERKFGHVREDTWSGKLPRNKVQNVMAVLGDLIFFGFIVACFVLILWPMLRDCFGLGGNRRGQQPLRRGWGGGWFGGGGGGGGGGGRPYFDPPPPYNSCQDGDSFSSRNAGEWRPGFWTGAMGGAAAGYGLGRRSGNNSSFGERRRYDSGEGSSRSRSPQFSSTTSTSTGFGSTRRR